MSDRPNKEFRSGFITVIGRTNVGKSTLMNALVGEKVAIVSNRPQTTRNQVRGVLTRPEYQLVFIDTPGLHRPRTKLGEYMVKTARTALREVDAVLAVVDASQKIGPGDLAAMESIRTHHEGAPVVLALNKIDLVHPSALLEVIDTFKDYDFIREIIPVSALKKDGVAKLEAVLAGFMPQGPQYFPEDMFTDQPEYVLAAEFIREQALLNLKEEIPHGVGVEIVRTHRRENGLLEIECNLYVEKASHKSIIIGKDGSMLKRIGTKAREEMEALFGEKIYLSVWVKVKEGWRDTPGILRELGYTEEKG